MPIREARFLFCGSPMKYCRFDVDGRDSYGLVELVAGNEVITRILASAPERVGDLEDLTSKRMPPLALADAALLPPVRPSKIVCVGRNYREHAVELGNEVDRKSTRLNSSYLGISYAVFCLKKKIQ